ncbi:MAG: hypothetical protein F6J93_21745 [Oscillatoria sp. SIO1A7]|nr:hypothetical protein [Oscillatoria sp. SIO1A7]
MRLNKYRPHLLVLPEDDANRQIANGFILHPNVNARSIQVLPPSGGWRKVLEDFRNVHAPEMQSLSNRMILLVIDFDRDEDRLTYIERQIPEGIRNRVFVLGVISEPESLRSDIQKSWEGIGEALAKDCADRTNELWGHDLLKHNQTELERMTSLVKPYLFRAEAR